MKSNNDSWPIIDLSQAESDILNYLMQFDGLMKLAGNNTSRLHRFLIDSRSAKSKEPIYTEEDIQAANNSLAAYINSLYNIVSDMHKNSDGFFRYIPNNACINLRGIMKPSQFANFKIRARKAYNEIFSSTNMNFHFRVFEDCIKILQQKDLTDFRVILVFTPTLEKKIYAVREEEFAEDLVLFNEVSDKYHFFNSVDILSRLNLKYDTVYLTKQAHRRTNAAEPIKDGQFNLYTDENGEIGAVVADVIAHNSSTGKNHYFSIKSFGYAEDSGVNLISLKINYPNFLSFDSILAGCWYLDAYERYQDQCSNAFISVPLIGMLLDKYHKDLPFMSNNLVTNNWGIISSKYPRVITEDIVSYISSPIFTVFGLDRKLFAETFLDSKISNDTKDKQKSIISPGLPVAYKVESFIKEAVGRGYYLVAIKNRSIYVKDYTKKKLSDEDCEILEYNIEYYKTEPKVIIHIKTPVLTIDGTISKKNCMGTIEFFYRYNDFETFFDYKAPAGNEVFPDLHISEVPLYKIGMPSSATRLL